MVTRAAIGWSLLLAGAGVACSPDARCAPLSRCDVHTMACQEQALAQAICLRDRDEEAEPVEVAFITEEEYAEHLRAEHAHEEELEHVRMRRGLALFGLSRARFSAAQEAADASEQASGGGFYDAETRRVVMIDDGSPMASGGHGLVLVHMMVHALQDRAGELAIQAGATTYDTALAAAALVEGEATLAQDEAQMVGANQAFDAIDYAAALRSFRNQALDGVEASEDVYRVAQGYFAYAYGASYLWPLQDDAGASALARAFADPPRSSYAVMQGDPTQPELRPNDLGESALPGLELEPVGTLHLGRFVFEAFRGLDEPAIEMPWWFPGGEEFVADTLSVFVDADGNVLASWRIRLDTTERAEELAAELAMLNPHLRIGREETDLWLIAAEDPDSIEALPAALTWSAAPEVDFGYAAARAEKSVQRPIHCALGTAR